MRGEKGCIKKCFLQILSVATIFDDPYRKLYFSIINDRNSYENDVDYKYFYCMEVNETSVKRDVRAFNKSVDNTIKYKVWKELYFTYEGIIKYFYTTRNDKARQLREWVSQTMFTIQMGTRVQQVKLFGKVLGVDYRTLNEFIKTAASKISCIYLMPFGDVGTLRESMNIVGYADDFLVCKFGYTHNLKQRMGENNGTYSGIENVKLHLKMYSSIDPDYLSNAEMDLKKYFKSLNVKIEYEKYQELVVLDPKILDNVNKVYKEISAKYSGYNKDLVKDVDKLNTEIFNISKDNRIEVLEQRDRMRDKYDENLKRKDEELKKQIELNNELNEFRLQKKDDEIRRLKNKLRRFQS